jgi:cobalt-zinc-cadmium efflux system membrane fusion protein
MVLALASGGCEKKSQAETTPSAEPKGPRMVKFDPKALERLGVKVDAAGSSAKDYEFEVTGTLEYNHEKYAEIGSIADGRITSINVHEGDLVKKGQVLATMMVPSIAGAQAEYMAASAAARIAKENEEREKALLAKDLTTAREAELARGEAVKTQADLSAAAAKLQALGAGRPGSGTAINGAGALQLLAPIEGIVVRRLAVLGRFMQAKETAFVVADPTDLRAAINIYESDLPYFRIGAESEISVDAFPGKLFNGVVMLVEADVDPKSRSVRALIKVPNPDRQLRPGEFVRATVKLPDTTTHTRLMVPAASVQPLGEDDVVFIEREPGKYEVRTVKIARRTSQIAEISEGLSKGERIVVEGAFVLRGEVSKQ